MTTRTLFLTAFWAIIAVAILGLPSCGTEDEQAKTAEIKWMTTDLDCAQVKIIPASIAREREAQWATYVQEGKLPDGWSKVNLQQLNRRYTITKQTIKRLGSMAGPGSDTLQIDSTEGVWLMVAVDTSSKTAQPPKLYMYCYNTAGVPVVLDIFSKNNPLRKIPLDPAQKTIGAAQKFTAAYEQQNPNLMIPESDGQGGIAPILSVSKFPFGFKFPLCDLIAIGENVADEKSLQAVFVIKPDENEDGKFRPDIYLKANLGEALADDPYYDFTDPCPNSCPPDTSMMVNY